MSAHPHGPVPDALPRLLGAAVLTAAGVAVCVWLFKEAVFLIEGVVLRGHAAHWDEVGRSWVLLVPAAGGLLVGVVLHWFGIPQDPGHGVTEVIEAATLETEEFPYRRARVKIPAAALSLGTGTSLGPEDPAIEIGGELAGWFSRRFGLSRAGAHRVLIMGAASGVSAAFHAPLAGLLMSIEVFRVRVVSGTTLLVGAAVAVAFGVAMLLSPAPPFSVRAAAPPLGTPLLVVLLLGAAAGALAAAQIRMVYWVAHRFHDWRAPPRWLKPALGGALLGALGLVLPQVLGIGYGVLESLADGGVRVLPLLVLLLAGKMVAMAVSHGSGLLGGFFAPSFFIGGALGALVGYGAVHVAPGWIGDGAPFAVIGMAAMLAGLVHAPLTAALVLRALGGGVTMLPSLVLACLVSFAVARTLERRSLYTFTLDLDHPAHGSRSGR